MGKILSTLTTNRESNLSPVSDEPPQTNHPSPYLDCPQQFSDFFSHFFEDIPHITQKEKHTHVENIYHQLYRSTNQPVSQALSIAEFNNAVNLSLTELETFGEIGIQTARQVKYTILGYHIDPKTHTPIYSNDGIRSMSIAIIINIGDKKLPPWLFSKEESDNFITTIDKKIKPDRPEELTTAKQEVKNLIGITDVKNKIAHFEQRHCSEASPYLAPQQQKKAPIKSDSISLTDDTSLSDQNEKIFSQYAPHTSSNDIKSSNGNIAPHPSITCEIEKLKWLTIDIISMDNVKNYTEAFEMIKNIEHRIKTENTNDLSLTNQLEAIKYSLFHHQISQLESFNTLLSTLSKNPP